MRERLDMVWNGKRTTARFPAYLWEMAMLAVRCSDDELVAFIRSDLGSGSFFANSSASEAVRAYLVGTIKNSLSSQASLSL